MKSQLVAVFAILVLAAPGFGQNAAPEAKPEREETIRKLVKLEHVDTREVVNLLGGWIRTFPSSELATILLEGSPEQVAKAEEVIRAVDRPGADAVSEGSIELDAYFLSAGSEASGGTPPPLVQPVVAELRQRFGYAHYGLLDSVLVQILIGTQANVEGQFSGTEELPTSYALMAKPTRVTGEGESRVIKLNQLVAVWKIPYRSQITDSQTGQTSYQTFTRDLRIATDVSVPEGKLVVVGKAGSPTSAEAIFLVLRARVVE